MHWLTLILLFPHLLAAAASAEFSFSIGEVAYLQWLNKPYDRIGALSDEDVAEFPRYMNVLSHEAAVQEIYLGVVCNSLNGYQIQIQAADALNKQSAEALAENGTTVRYHMELEALPNTIQDGARTETQLDITGLQDSVHTSFSEPAGLPLSFREPHVFRLSARLLPDLSKRTPEYIDYYVGIVTATVYLP